MERTKLNFQSLRLPNLRKSPRTKPYIRPSKRPKFEVTEDPDPVRRLTLSLSEKTHDEIPNYPDTDIPVEIQHNQVLSMWYKSRLQEDGSVRAPGHYRPATRRNVLIAAKIAPRVLRELFLVLWNVAPIKAVVFLLARLSAGILPAWQTLAFVNLLDCVQDSLAATSVNKPKIIGLAVTNFLAANAEGFVDFLTQESNQSLMEDFNERIEFLYLKMQLALDIPALSNKVTNDLVFESGVFSGFENATLPDRSGYWGGGYARDAWSRLEGLLVSFTSTIHILTDSWILLTTILKSTRHGITWSGVAFLVLSFLPSALSLLRFLQPTPAPWSPLHRRKRDVLALGSSGEYKQEVILFGLADWVLGQWSRWSNQIRLEKANRKKERNKGRYPVMIAQTSVPTLLYTLLALQLLEGFSLGSIRLYQSCASSIVQNIRSFSTRSETALQQVFLAAAFFESQHLIGREDKKRIPYESSTRGGMKIEAKNLSFKYPGKSEYTLRNINLTVEPGETLAVVGFNGSGKTTLVKVLTGLFDYEGELLINGREARLYDRTSLHARMTACFQDFSKYGFTARENVGIGNVSKIHDIPAINASLKRGGAMEVVEEIGGLDTLLSRENVRNTSDAEQLHVDRNLPKSISGGQWQRIALARAFMRSDQADLIVFDEPSASLDARAEHELFQTIHSLSSSRGSGSGIRTTIYISHRFSTVRRADKIAVVENGTITELGPHDQLMRAGGRYAEFFNLQAQAFAEPS